MSQLLQQYKKSVIPAMKEKFGYKNDLQVPRLNKVVLNVGLSQGLKDQKFLEITETTLKRITGQKPVQRKAKKSISEFKIRQGQVVGMTVSLHGGRMYDFIEKFVNLTLPRVRDFRGLSPKQLDVHGNFSIGFRENIAFPEIRSDEVERLHGIQVTVGTTAKNNQEALELLKLLGFPFKS